MNVPLQLVVNSAMIGGVYVLFALGLTLIFGVMKIINFAHGVFFATAALIVSKVSAYVAAATGWPNVMVYGLSLLSSIGAVAGLGALIYWIGFHKFSRDLIGSFIFSVGLLLFGQGVLLTIFTGAPQITQPLIEGSIRPFGTVIDLQRMIVFAVAITVTVGLHHFLHHSKLGWALRAVADDYEAAALQGIRYQRTSLYGFMIGSVLAALAGGLIAPLTAVAPSIGDDQLVKAFIIIIVGGLGSIPGAILGGFAIAFIESVAGFWFDLSTASIVMFVLVMIILIVRPQGILGHAAR